MAGLEASQQVLDSQQYQALTQYLADTRPAVDGAIDAFCKSIEDKYKSTSSPLDVEELLWTSWKALVAIAASTPYPSPSRETLAKFLVQLAYRPTLTYDGQACEIDSMVVWRDLPVLGWELREAWNFAATDASDQIQKDQWINLNAFTATLISSLHSSAIDRPDYSLFGIWIIRTALEDQAQPDDVAVEAAAAWLMYAASAMWDFSQQSKSFDGKVAAPGSLLKDQNWTGFSESRWNAWLQRLDDLKATSSSERIAQLVQQSLGAMSSAFGT